MQGDLALEVATVGKVPHVEEGITGKLTYQVATMQHLHFAGMFPVQMQLASAGVLCTAARSTSEYIRAGTTSAQIPVRIFHLLDRVLHVPR